MGRGAHTIILEITMSGLSGKAPTPPPTAASATPAKQWTGSMAEKPAEQAKPDEDRVTNAEEFAAYMKKADPKSYRAVQAEIEKKKKKGVDVAPNINVAGTAYSANADQVLRNIKGAK